MRESAPLLEVNNLVKHFVLRHGPFLTGKTIVRAVDGVSFSVGHGSTLGLVGESGSGKSTVGLAVLRLIPATAGSVKFAGKEVLTMNRSQMRRLRRRMQVVFQDPVGSLDPRMSVEAVVSEPLLVHERLSAAQRREKAAELLALVGLDTNAMPRYPHEFSGGQRQRIGIARALATRPDLIICDEPVSALDVSIQAQILNLLKDLQSQFGLSYLFIAHNLAVVEHFVDDVAVMYCGKIVETGSRDAVYQNPLHPYTQALFAAAPRLGSSRTVARSLPLQGETPSPTAPPRGCAFHPRCFYTREVAQSLSDAQTVYIDQPAFPTRIVRACVESQPTLQPTAHDPHHHHACVLKHHRLSSP